MKMEEKARQMLLYFESYSGRKPQHGTIQHLGATKRSECEIVKSAKSRD